jgi:hypothetical protein
VQLCSSCWQKTVRLPNATVSEIVPTQKEMAQIFHPDTVTQELAAARLHENRWAAREQVLGACALRKAADYTMMA